MITDEVFSQELDISLKRQKILKKQRNLTICEYLQMPIEDRDSILELANRDARNFEYEKKQSRKIPLESEEQAIVVDWFRRAYPQMVIMLINNDDNRDQTHNIIMGLHKGASDLQITDLHLYIEMKRKKPMDSVWSDDQQSFKHHVEGHGDTYIICYGADDAKEKILNHIEYYPQLQKKQARKLLGVVL